MEQRFSPQRHKGTKNSYEPPRTPRPQRELQERDHRLRRLRRFYEPQRRQGRKELNHGGHRAHRDRIYKPQTCAPQAHFTDLSASGGFHRLFIFATACPPTAGCPRIFEKGGHAPWWVCHQGLPQTTFTFSLCSRPSCRC
jgi:hypothetical protein